MDNREIKFRAWDKTKKEMIFDGVEYCCRVLSLWNEEEWYIHIWVMTPSPRELEAFVIMQYTWLKDKNWKEIYEGDFIAKTNVVIHFLDRKGWERNPWQYINERISIENPTWKLDERILRWDEIRCAPIEWSDSTWYEPFCDSENNCWHCWWWDSPSMYIVVWNMYEDMKSLFPIDETDDTN